ncbi:hypothetical protein BBJ28_00000488 [Nothophytophthora sp. Chile5]|nr:hypothetical protein BBJ28_00000488 [Nothophytophthora sp. Chile5]
MTQQRLASRRPAGYEVVNAATSDCQPLPDNESDSDWATSSATTTDAAMGDFQVVSSSKGHVKETAPTGPLCGVQAWICGLSALSGFLFGYDLCVMVVALPLIQQFELSTTLAESIVSTLMLGAVVGSLAGGVIADWCGLRNGLDRIGRKPANLITAAFFLSGSLFMTFAGSLRSMLVGRFLAGLAVGSSGPCVSVYVAEIAQPKSRGALVTVNEVGNEGVEIPPAPMGDMLSSRRVVFCMTIAFCHILTGANAMLYYSSYILGELHTGDEHAISHLSKEILVGMAKLAGVCSAVVVVDRIGRRPLLLLGTSLMLSSHFVFALCFWSLDASHSELVQTIGEWNLYIFIFAWNLSWAPLMWVVCSELLPDDFRSVGMGLTFAVFWLGSALVNQTLVSIFHAIGAGNTFLFYSLSDAANDELLAAQQQLEELECMLSMFPDADELQYDPEDKQALEDYVCGTARPPRPQTRIQYSIHFKDLRFGREVPTLTLTCPRGYPVVNRLQFEVHCPQLSRLETEKLNADLLALTTSALASNEVAALQLYQQMHELLSDVQTHRHQDDEGEEADAEAPRPRVILGRRAIYFHHIIASSKRRVVKEWALELQLGGFSKIGWPGVVIVEGAEASAQEYVRRLQHLRWKQMTVRGEQTQELAEGDARGLDALRRLPRGFQEFPESGMSSLAAECRAAGLEELFLTTMKIYNRSKDHHDASGDEEGDMDTKEDTHVAGRSV